MKIFPSINEALITTAIISFFIGIAVTVALKLDAETYKVILAGMTTLLAAYFGARYAFTLQNKKQDEERDLQRIEAANITIFNIITMNNTFSNYNKQFIAPSKSSPARHLEIPPSMDIETVRELDLNSLAFLMTSSDPNILGEMRTLQSRVLSTLAVIKERSELHRHGVQPALEAAGLSEGNPITNEDLDRILGERTHKTLIQMTNQIIDFTEEIIGESEELANKLHNITRELYKGHKVIGMVKLNKASNPTP
jgi:hypothetical protein